jgi:hypothetical protein
MILLNVAGETGAGDEIRTHDPNLGNSIFRISRLIAGDRQNRYIIL